MKNLLTVLTLVLSFNGAKSQASDFEYFYHPSPAHLTFVCPDNGDYKMYMSEKFGSKVIDINSNEFVMNMYGTPVYPVYSYNSSYCDIGLGNFIDYDVFIPRIMHIDDQVSFRFDIYENDDYPTSDYPHQGLHTIDIPGPTYLFSYDGGGTYEADAEGNIVSTWSNIQNGNFLRKNDDIYIIDYQNMLFKLNNTTNMWDEVYKFSEDFDWIRIITYDESLDKHYLLNDDLWELNIGENDVSTTKLIDGVTQFNVFNGIIYFTEKENAAVIKSYNPSDQLISDYYTTDPNNFISTLSNDGEALLVGTGHKIYTEHYLPLLQVVKDGSNYNPDRVDFTIENLDIQKEVNYHFTVQNGPNNYRYMANVGLTFTFDITNNGAETLTELTSYDDAVFFHFGPKMHNHQLLVDIPSGEKQTITYTRTTEVLAESTKVNVSIPGANYKIDRDLSDNTLSFDINLSSKDLIVDNSGLYPNPVFDIVFFKDKPGLYSGQIFDAMGQTVHQFNDQDLSSGIDVASLASGYYSIILADKNGLNNTILKFVKM